MLLLAVLWTLHYYYLVVLLLGSYPVCSASQMPEIPLGYLVLAGASWEQNPT